MSNGDAEKPPQALPDSAPAINSRPEVGGAPLMSSEKPPMWEVRDRGLADWPGSPFNPWRRLMIVTPKPAGAGPDVRFGDMIAEINRGVGEHDAAERDARLIAAAPDMLATLRHVHQELVDMLSDTANEVGALLARIDAAKAGG